ncbi:MAG: hypothetical protein K8S97_12845 [Anaerolineae bacterium]|nr:hypothetical protein [Anaerolineae bacterium]
MAYGSWDAVERNYRENFVPHTRESKTGLGKLVYAHALAMLDLIPLLRAHPGFEAVVPGTSLSTLTLKVPGKRTQICVWYEDGFYEVYWYDRAVAVEDLAAYEDERGFVMGDDVVIVLQRRVELLLRGDAYP